MMEQDAMMDILKKFGIYSQKDFIRQAFSRNIGLLTPEEQERLSHARVAIPGMGGVGGVHLITLARTGIGKFNIADFDVFEPANMNRQFGARVPDLGRKKLDVMKEQALSVNPYLELNLFEEGIHDKNMDVFLDEVDVVVDGLDFFQFEVRRALFKKAAEKGIYVITAAPLGFSSALLVFAPDKGMKFDEYFNISKNMKSDEQYLAFAMGLAPRPTHIEYMDLKKVDLDSKAGPSLNIACQICSGMAATETIKVVLKKGRIRPVPCYIQYDPYLQKLRNDRLLMGNKNPVQRIKTFIVKKLLKKNKKKNKPPVVAPNLAVIKENEIPTQIIAHIIQLATLAPSADNCQPWSFEWSNNSLKLFVDMDKANFFYDVNHESTNFTFGAVIENISLAASGFGLELKLSLYPDPEKKNLISIIEFRFSNKHADPLLSGLQNRCVNRNRFDGNRIDNRIIQNLYEVMDTQKVNFFLIENSEKKKLMESIVFDSDRVLFENKKLHQELFEWINLKFDKPVGMNTDVLGVDFIQKKTFSLISDWEKLKFLNAFGMSTMIAKNSIRLLKSAPCYCLFTIKKTDPEDYIKGGRIVERFWIRANQLGLSVQPMAGFIFLINHWHHDKATMFNKKHQQLIKGMKSKLDLILNDNDESQRAFMFFRIGYAKVPESRTGRLDVKNVAKFI